MGLATESYYFTNVGCLCTYKYTYKHSDLQIQLINTNTKLVHLLNHNKLDIINSLILEKQD